MGWKVQRYNHSLYRILVNDLYSGFTHISIERIDTKPITTTWDVLQAIKNDAVGENRYAIEVFPDTASLVYSANMRHLWVFPEGERIELGIPLWDGQMSQEEYYHKPRRGGRS